MRARIILLAMLVLLSSCATNQSSRPDDLISKLQQGGYVIFFRHAATEQSQKDTDLKDPTNCAAQRHLNETGREQARIIGEGFESHQIPVGDVMSSIYCRCVNTAKIAFGKVETTIDITSYFGVTPQERLRRVARIRALINMPPKPGTNTVLVSHKWMFKDAAGHVLAEGEAAIFKPQEEGVARLIRRVKPEEWASLRTLN